MPRKVKSAQSRTGAKKKAAGRKPRSTHQERYVKDLLARGEAAKLDKHGKLPLQATAVITKENPDGSVEVKEVRKKLF